MTIEIGSFDYVGSSQSAPRSYGDELRDHIALGIHADSLGFRYHFIAEHHEDPLLAECPSPNLLLAAIAAETRRVHLGALGYVLPLWDTARLAEEIKMLDHLSHDRMELGLVTGINKDGYDSYGVPSHWKNRHYIFWTKVSQLQKQLKRLGVRELPIWAPSRPKLLGAYLGWNYAQWVAPSVSGVKTLFDEHRKWYGEAFPDSEHQLPEPSTLRPEGPRLAILREVYVEDADSKARLVGGKSWLEFWKRFYNNRTDLKENIGVPRAERRKQLEDVDYSIADSSFICGSPETVTQRIKNLMIDTGANVFLGDFSLPLLEHQQVLDSMSLFANGIRRQPTFDTTFNTVLRNILWTVRP